MTLLILLRLVSNLMCFFSLVLAFDVTPFPPLCHWLGLQAYSGKLIRGEKHSAYHVCWKLALVGAAMVLEDVESSSKHAQSMYKTTLEPS